MVAAAMYNMLDFRAMCGRCKTHQVSESNYKKPDHHFGRVPIVIHFGDFLQLKPTANTSLIQDLNARDQNGAYVLAEPPTVEIQHAIYTFRKIQHVFELQGTKRFVSGDPLIEFLACMREGRRFPTNVWNAFEQTWATDNNRPPVLDKRHSEPRFATGFGVAMYWETLSRWIAKRPLRDARGLGVPLIFLQASDECQSIDRSMAKRLLNVPNIHITGHIHGVFASHVGMRVRFTVKFNSTLGLVQEQRGTILDFLWDKEDAVRYLACKPGCIFKPKKMPAGIWLQLDDFDGGKLEEEMTPLLQLGCQMDDATAQKRARGILLLQPVETTFTWRSSQDHIIKRTGFGLTHAHFLTSTASQGHTIRTGVTIDCERIQQKGRQGIIDEVWWLHLYVMFSRPTRMQDMLLLRPPPRELLERGPPESLAKALAAFHEKIPASKDAAEQLAREMNIDLPP